MNERIELLAEQAGFIPKNAPKAINDLVDYLAENNNRLRKVLQQIADKNPFHNQCPPMNDLQYYAQIITEMVGIANAALNEGE